MFGVFAFYCTERLLLWRNSYRLYCQRKKAPATVVKLRVNFYFINFLVDICHDVSRGHLKYMTVSGNIKLAWKLAQRSFDIFTSLCIFPMLARIIMLHYFVLRGCPEMLHGSWPEHKANVNFERHSVMSPSRYWRSIHASSTKIISPENRRRLSTLKYAATESILQLLRDYAVSFISSMQLYHFRFH